MGELPSLDSGGEVGFLCSARAPDDREGSCLNSTGILLATGGTLAKWLRPEPYGGGQNARFGLSLPRSEEQREERDQEQLAWARARVGSLRKKREAPVFKVAIPCLEPQRGKQDELSADTRKR